MLLIKRIINDDTDVNNHDSMDDNDIITDPL